MEFFTYHDYMMHTKSVIYIIMGLLVLAGWGAWAFITGRDEEMHPEGEHHEE